MKRKYGSALARESEAEKAQIAGGTTALARHFDYDKVDYLSHYYSA